ncbi:hypothetical protein P8452_38100 [Trifolium repens]|nr:hypothetical protein P8452_38100 [Trifolium repens]
MPEVVVELRFNQCRPKSRFLSSDLLQAFPLLLTIKRYRFFAFNPLKCCFLTCRTHVNEGDSEENLKKALLKYS